MAIVNAVWERDIWTNLFPDNSFMQQSMDESAFADAYGVVHSNVAGSRPSVSRNRSSFPATVSEREDADNSWTMDSFTTDPIRVRNSEEIEASYDKRASVLGEHIEALNAEIGDWLAYNWAPTTSAQMVRTSGADRAAFVEGGTGNRKKITLADIKAIKAIFDAEDVPQENRFCLMPAQMYNDLLDIDNVLSFDKMGTAALATGAVDKILGFTIYIRSVACRYTNASTPVRVLPTADGAATHNAGALFWHKNAVKRSKGTVTVFEDVKSATHYGDVLSAEIRAGGVKRSGTSTEVGIAAIIEAAGA